MNLFNALVKYSNFKSSENNSKPILFSDDFIRHIAWLITGFLNPIIDIDEYIGHSPKGYCYRYFVIGGDKYNSNYFYLNDDLKLTTVRGDGGNIIRKIFEFIEYWDFDKFLQWYTIINLETNIARKIKRDIETTSDSSNRGLFGFDLIIKFDTNTLEKYHKLNKIHQKLTALSPAEISEKLDILYSYWEPERFKISDYWKGYVTGSFSNNDIPNLKIKKPKTIIFPDDSRGSVCKNFMVLPDNQMDDLFKMEIGGIINLKNNKSNLKTTKYRILEHRDKFAIALLNCRTGKVQFATHISTATNAYAALFDVNKVIYNSWKRKKYQISNENS